MLTKVLRGRPGTAALVKRAREEAKAESKKKPRTSGTVGVIIVPNAPTALLTLVNAADLLERNTYVTPAQKRQQGAKKEPVVKVSRTRGDGVVNTVGSLDGSRPRHAGYLPPTHVNIGEYWQIRAPPRP